MLLRRTSFLLAVLGTIVVMGLPTTAAPVATIGVLQVTSPDDFLMTGTRLTFSTTAQRATGPRFVTVRNTGGGPVTFTTALATTGVDPGYFQFPAGQPNRFTLAAGATVDIGVRFVPTAYHGGTASSALARGGLNITPPAGTLTVPLLGLQARNVEGNNEPVLDAVFAALGYSTRSTIRPLNAAVPSNYYPTAPSSGRLPQGDEVVSPYWRKANTALPVTIRPIARYVGFFQGGSGATQWAPKGTSSFGGLYTFPPDSFDANGNRVYNQSQTLLPLAEQPLPRSFWPTTPFWLRASGPGSDDRLNNATNPNLHTHDLRFFPAKGPFGNVIPDAWLMAMDLPNAGRNFDYQDQVALVTNMAPEMLAAPPAGTALDFAQAAPGTVADKSGQGTGFTSVQPSTNARPAYVPANLTLDTANGALRVLSTAGTNTGAGDSQQNALQVGFDGSRRKVVVSARLLGPFANLTTDYQQEAVYFGPDEDNYAKAEIEHNGAGRKITFYFEQGLGGGSGTKASVTLPVGATAVTLAIVADPVGIKDVPTADGTSTVPASVGTVSVFYAAATTANPNPPLVALGPPVQTFDVMRWFSRQSRAGILTSNAGRQGAATPPAITATYDSFSVQPG